MIYVSHDVECAFVLGTITGKVVLVLEIYPKLFKFIIRDKIIWVHEIINYNLEIVVYSKLHFYAFWVIISIKYTTRYCSNEPPCATNIYLKLIADPNVDYFAGLVTNLSIHNIKPRPMR